jgi:hypothetical protein
MQSAYQALVGGGLEAIRSARRPSMLEDHRQPA